MFPLARLLCAQDQDESVTRRLQDLVEEYGQSCAAMIVLREPGQQSRAAVDAITRGRHYRTLFTLVRVKEGPHVVGNCMCRRMQALYGRRRLFALEGGLHPLQALEFS